MQEEAFYRFVFWKADAVTLLDWRQEEKTMKATFYICRHCGNQIAMLHASGVPVVCCGEEMEALVPNTVEASVEKHLPVVTVNGDRLRAEIGSVEHPMVPEHHIEWICVKTERGGQLQYLKPGEKPRAEFCLNGEKAIAVYAYCNIHGLWMTKCSDAE